MGASHWGIPKSYSDQFNGYACGCGIVGFDGISGGMVGGTPAGSFGGGMLLGAGDGTPTVFFPWHSPQLRQWPKRPRRDRRFAKDWEKTIESSSAWALIASIRLLSRRLARYC